MEKEKEKGESDNEMFTCGICLDWCDDAMVSTCLQQFCRKCIVRAQENRKECPTCNVITCVATPAPHLTKHIDRLLKRKRRFIECTLCKERFASDAILAHARDKHYANYKMCEGSACTVTYATKHVCEHFFVADTTLQTWATHAHKLESKELTYDVLLSGETFSCADEWVSLSIKCVNQDSVCLTASFRTTAAALAFDAVCTVRFGDTPICMANMALYVQKITSTIPMTHKSWLWMLLAIHHAKPFRLGVAYHKLAA